MDAVCSGGLSPGKGGGVGVFWMHERATVAILVSTAQ